MAASLIYTEKEVSGLVCDPPRRHFEAVGPWEDEAKVESFVGQPQWLSDGGSETDTSKALEVSMKKNCGPWWKTEPQLGLKLNLFFLVTSHKKSTTTEKRKVSKAEALTGGLLQPIERNQIWP